MLTSFPPSLSEKAVRSLRRLGVTPLVGSMVVGIDGEAVTIVDPDGRSERIPARTVIWAAGVAAAKLGARLGELTGAEVDRVGRVAVEPDLTLPGHPRCSRLATWFVCAARRIGHDAPGVAPAAIQQGRYAARIVRARLRGRDTRAFHYHDKGNVATIGRGAGVAHIKPLKLSGFIGWVTWLGVHLWYLVGFQNRVLVFIRWSFGFATHGRGARVIAEPPVAGESVGSGST